MQDKVKGYKTEANRETCKSKGAGGSNHLDIVATSL